METPGYLQSHEKDYRAGAYKAYTLFELGAWVHLLATRADHRSDPEKRAKDLYDARNYWRMMGEALDELES